MDKNIKWGIIAPGGIAHKFASDLKLVPDACLAAVGSRSIERSKEFAKQFGAEKAYGSYEELAKSPNIDVVYIASPHTGHFEHTMLCLENGKSVLCEKPIAMNSRELEAMIAKAKEKGLFLMEAFWTRFIPSYLKFRQIIKDGIIGEIRFVQSDFGIQIPQDPQQRHWNKDLGGGALLDIGIYPVFMSLDIAGVPDEIVSKAQLWTNGVDLNTSLVFKYSDKNIMANLSSTILAKTPVEASVSGTKGRVKLNRMWHTPSSVELFLNNEKSTFTFDEKGFGYEYEIMEVNKCLKEGKKESEFFPLSSSRTLHNTLDTIRKQIGLVYDADNR